jgi:peptidoglycan/xylan/chitin deacetylase (PgdA/CDA1 family)
MMAFIRKKYLTYLVNLNRDHTPRLLEILKERNVTATFFILGQSISRFSDLSRTTRNPNYKKNRGILRRMVADGHEVGSHSFDHTVFTWLDKHEVSKQLDRTADLVEYVTGYRPKLFRAPEGYNLCN